MYQGFKPNRGYEQDADTLAWCREMNVYADLYLMYNDDDERHMMDAIDNNGMNDMSADEVHKECLDLINHVGADTVEKYNTESEIDAYIKECERSARLAAHGVDADGVFGTEMDNSEEFTGFV